MIELVDVSKSYGSRRLFAGVNLRVGDRERVGLVGPNGTGKTTLFRILTGEVSPDTGRIEAKKGIRIGYLSQEVHPSRAMDMGIREYCVRESRGVGPLLDQRAALLADLDAGRSDEATVHRLAAVEDALHHREADSLPKQAESVLTGLGFPPEDFDKPLRTMSGGLLMRAELARLLLDRPDLLLLDEPTNHLDLEGLLWFEEYLKGFPGAVVLVAHDREFLNRTVDRVVEVSVRGATDYGGNPNLTVYDRYVLERAKAIELAWKRYEEQQAYIKDQEDFIAANKVRKDRAAVAQSRKHMLDKLERLVPPEAVRRVHFQFPQPPRSPDLVVALDGVAKRYGPKTVFQGMDLRLHRGERVALVGINGAGKSTLLRLAAGITQPDEGSRHLADGVGVGYFAQDQYEILKADRTAHQHMLEVADYATAPHVRSILGAFLFGTDDIDKKVASLSGGEKARLLLCRMLLQPFGLLVLDEPTNHLDIASREILEDALKDHQGTILFTSHDRRFMDTVADAIIEMRDGRLTRYEGNYSYYVTKARAANAPSPGSGKDDAAPLAPTVRDQDRDRKREEAERRNRLYRILKPLRDRVTSFEARIEVLETELRTVDEALVSPDLYADVEKARVTGQKAKDLRAGLDALYDAWTAAAEELSKAEQSEDAD
jgi:ATP-binding cassette subfamily F protein 3